MLPLPTGTVTLLFTDIAGSTALWERDRDAMQAALAQHGRIPLPAPTWCVHWQSAKSLPPR